MFNPTYSDCRVHRHQEKIGREVFSDDIDLIHFNLCTPWAGAAGLVAALSLPNTRVVRVDQLPLRTTDAIALWRTRALALRVEAHVAVGEASARRMEDFYALGRHTVLSVPNGVPDLPSNKLATAKQSDGKLLVGSVGRLDAMKAHDVSTCLKG